MNTTHADLGNISLGFKSLIKDTNIIKVKSDQETIDLGVKYSPEFMCFPFKLMLGNTIKAIRKGADTVIMQGGFGPCRAGYYGELKKTILHDLGLKAKFIFLENLQGFRDLKEHLGLSWTEVSKRSYTMLAKIKIVEYVEKKINIIRPSVKDQIVLDKMIKEFFTQKNFDKSLKEISHNAEVFIKKIKALDKNIIKPIKIGIIGEIYVLLDDFSNSKIEKRLNLLGAEVHRSISFNDAVYNLVLFRRHKPERNWVRKSDELLKHTIGGHGKPNITHAIEFGEENFDGIIQLSPFACIPEIVCKSILPQVNKKYKIPILSISIDEQTAHTGLQTRIESFIDLIRYKNEVLLRN